VGHAYYHIIYAKMQGKLIKYQDQKVYDFRFSSIDNLYRFNTAICIFFYPDIARSSQPRKQNFWNFRQNLPVL